MVLSFRLKAVGCRNPVPSVAQGSGMQVLGFRV